MSGFQEKAKLRQQAENRQQILFALQKHDEPKRQYNLCHPVEHKVKTRRELHGITDMIHIIDSLFLKSADQSRDIQDPIIQNRSDEAECHQDSKRHSHIVLNPPDIDLAMWGNRSFQKIDLQDGTDENKKHIRRAAVYQSVNGHHRSQRKHKLQMQQKCSDVFFLAGQIREHQEIEDVGEQIF